MSQEQASLAKKWAFCSEQASRETLKGELFWVGLSVYLLVDETAPLTEAQTSWLRLRSQEWWKY